jgi:hypothetical protein
MDNSELYSQRAAEQITKSFVNETDREIDRLERELKASQLRIERQLRHSKQFLRWGIVLVCFSMAAELTFTTLRTMQRKRDIEEMRAIVRLKELELMKMTNHVELEAPK